MKSPSKELKARLIEIRKTIKRKYKAFKDGTAESDILLEKQYRPIIKELRKTTSSNIDIKKEEPTVKEEPMDYEEQSLNYESTDDDDETPTSFTPATVSTPKASQLSDLVSTPLSQASTSQFVKLYFKNPVTRKYMEILFKDAGGSNKEIDNVFGPHFDGSKLMIGDQELDFDNEGKILIGGTDYGSSEGLYELIFKKRPDKEKYTEDDLKTYKSVLFATNAHRAGNKPDGRIKSYRDTKYKNIIKKLFPFTGKGMNWKTLKTRDIIHWDDPNELIDRLRHIAMSTESGNRVHGNEVLSIIEELREAGFIKGAGNSRYKSLLK
jgi:hypothetical protein